MNKSSKTIVDIEKNSQSQQNEYDKIKTKISSNLESVIITEKEFYTLFMVLEEKKKVDIIEELSLFTQGINSYKIFINNISVTLSNRYGSFGNISLQIIDYLKYLSKNDLATLKKIYKTLNDTINNKQNNSAIK